MPLDGAAVEVSAATHATCALLTTGSVRCWGQAAIQALGDGFTYLVSGPVSVTGLSNAVEVVTAEDYACARLAEGSIQCWGTWGYRLPGTETAVVGSGAISSKVPVVVGGF